MGKLWFISLAKKILNHLCYWLFAKMKGRFFNVKKSTSLMPKTQKYAQSHLKTNARSFDCSRHNF